MAWVESFTWQYKLKEWLAEQASHGKVYVKSNGDLVNVPDFRGNFSKSILHDPITHLVSREDYKRLLKAISRADWKYLPKVTLGTPTGIKLVDPAAIFNVEIIGRYQGSYKIPAAPSITSAEAAGEMIELYEMALARDIPFVNYATDPSILQACAELNLLSDFRGPKIAGQVTPQTIFRGNTAGDLVGPLISQFLLLGFKYGAGFIDQKYSCTQAGLNHILTLPSFWALQNGTVTEKSVPDPTPRYIYNLRCAADYIRVDEPCQPYFNAALILLQQKVPFCPGSPYVNGTFPNQNPFICLGKVDIFDLLGRVSKLAMDACWFVKYINLKLRPEEFGYEVQRAKTGDHPLHLHRDLLNNPVLQRVFARQGNYLLSQAYPEGAPAHPSYPSGHAVLAGSQITILKAFFKADHQLAKTFIASADGLSLLEVSEKVTVAGELDKLASNCGGFRNAAGIHYRTDMEWGILLGEQVAVELLKEIVHRYAQPVTFEFPLRNGKIVKIKNKVK